jgi:ABC-2 type transport system ATP-binding protein
MIEAKNLTKRFGRTIAIAGITFTVQPGRITGLLGPNGSGKSTTMRMILGLDNPTSGSVTVMGRPYRDLPQPIRHVGALLEAGSVVGNRSARRHLTWIARAGGIEQPRVSEVLGIVGLNSVSEKRISEYSLGMKQRLGIAAALLGDPDVLIFDEPVNGLDPEGIRWFRGLMKEMAGNGKTILVSSHLMSELQLTADHVIVLARGRIVADSSMADIIRMGRGNAAKVVSPNADFLGALLQRAEATVVRESPTTLMVTGMETVAIGELAALNGIVLHELTPQLADLESAYMAITRDAGDFTTNQGTLTYV